jgi:hypothetical protein
MADGFDLDLRGAENQMEGIDVDGADRVVLGVLDGTTDPAEWAEEIGDGNVLFLAVEGDLEALASPFAGDVKEAGGTLMHFREFLVVAPPGVDVDADRLD